MSGICGVFNLNGEPVQAVGLRAMLTMLRQRGHGDACQWQDGAVGLGHIPLATTPGLAIENQPFIHSESGCVIAADIRLDYRMELACALGIREQCADIGDAELVMEAWLTWGESCLDHLYGDFAFAIWDPRDKRVFCARDPFGMRPLFYHRTPGRRFILASDPRAIVALPQVPYRIDQARIADFLVQQLEWIDYTGTFYEEIFRLPAGSMMSVTPERVGVAKYWLPTPGPQLGQLSNKEFTEGFLDVFTESVQERLQVPEMAVGSMLSGGMDSGTVVAVAKELLQASCNKPLATYSVARQNPGDCAESIAINVVTRIPSIAPTIIHPEVLEHFYDALIVGNEEPFDSEYWILKSIYLKAASHGIRVILDGGGGDIVLNPGSYIVSLIRQGRPRQAMAEIRGETEYWGDTTFASALLRYAGAAITPKPVKRLLRRTLRLESVERALRGSLIARDFAESVNIGARLGQLRETFRVSSTPDYASEVCALIQPNVVAGRERYARIAAAAGVEARDPFLDRRLIDYCTRLPGSIRLKNGWPKWVLREAMKNRLPDEIRCTGEKPHLGWMFNACVSKLAVDQGDLDLAELQAALGGYVDPMALTNAWYQFIDGTDPEPIHTAFSLALWLRETASRPVVPDDWFG